MRRTVLLISIAVLAAGCASTTTLTDANKLATAGQAVSKGVVAYFDASAKAYVSYRAGQVFGAALQNIAPAASPKPAAKKPAKSSPNSQPATAAQCTAPSFLSADDLKVADRYFDNLGKARDFYLAMGRTYGALNALASYDLRGEFAKSSSKAVTAANVLLGALDQSTISSDAGSPVGDISGAFAQGEQAKLVRESSARIRAVVEGVRQAMEENSSVFTGAQKREIEGRWNITKKLWCDGYVDAKPLLDIMVRNTGVSIGTIAITAKDPTAPAIEALIQSRALTGKREPEKQFSKIVDAMAVLIDQHRRLESGLSVDVDKLTAVAGEIDALSKTLSEGIQP